MGERMSSGSCCRCFKLNFHLRGHILAYLDHMRFFFLCACACFCKHVAHVCLHGLCLHNAVFCSAGCAGVQQCSGCTWPRLCWKVYVFHVLCSVLKSGSRDDRMNPICNDTHTLTCTSLSEIWLLGSEWLQGGTVKDSDWLRIRYVGVDTVPQVNPVTSDC